MYLVPREVYERSNLKSPQGETNCGSKGDTLNGNVHGAAQVNHIEMAEGTKLTIKPNRGLAVDSEEDNKRTKNPTAAIDKAEAEREAELEDEDEDAEVPPFVVGDAAFDYGDRDEEKDEPRRNRRETSDFGAQTSLPPVISGNTVDTQTESYPESSSKSMQTMPRERAAQMSRAMQTEAPAVKNRRAAAAQANPEGRSEEIQTEPPMSTSTLMQTDPMARFDLKDMTDLRRKAIGNWSKIRKNTTSLQKIKRIPFAALNDQVPMQQKLEMMRRIIRDQAGVAVSQAEGRRRAAAIPVVAGVNVSPDVVEPPKPRSPVKKGVSSTSKRDKPKLAAAKRDAVDQAIKAVMQSSKSSAPTKRAAVEQAIKSVMQSSKSSSSAKRAAVEQAIKSVMKDSEPTPAPMRVQTVTDAPMIVDLPKRKGTKRKPQAAPSFTAKKRQTKKKVVKPDEDFMKEMREDEDDDDDDDEEMREHIDERLSQLQGTQKKRGKRRAAEMEWPEEIEIRSGKSEKKKTKPKK